MKNLLLTLFLIILSKSFFACSCRSNGSFYLHYNLSDDIFKGKVIRKQTDPNKRIVTLVFRVLTKYKGETAPDTISIETGLGHGDCGLPADTNQVWIIFSANKHTGICSPNFLIENDNSNFSWGGMYDAKLFLTHLNGMPSVENGYIKEYDTKKHLIAEGMLSGGIAQGYWKYYDPGSKGKFYMNNKTFYTNGIKDSVEFSYYENGKVWTESAWKNKASQVKETYYYESGTVELTRGYYDGKMDGEWKRFYQNKQLMEQQYYDKGKATGTWLYYDETGKLTKTVIK